MRKSAKLISMSIEDLWKLRETVRDTLTAKMNAEKAELERRLAKLHLPAAKRRRPYPPVHPKFANPDAPDQVWSGRG